MPTEKRLRSAITEISEKIELIGYEVNEVIGPLNSDDKKIGREEFEENIQEDVHYYLTAGIEKISFYIQFRLDREFAMIVYPLDVFRQLSILIDNKETEAILTQAYDWDKLGAKEKEQLHIKAINKITQNTNSEQFLEAAFNLTIYASSENVQYKQNTTDDGFPVKYQCVRPLFPYTEQMTISHIDNRIFPVINAGERGKRYIQYIFRLDKENKQPQEYEIKSLL